MSLKSKIIIGYFILVAVISCFAIIGVYERNHLQKIENSVHEIRRVRQDINIAHRHVARLATLGEGVIGWKAADSLLVNHLPEVARRATRIRTVRRKWTPTPTACARVTGR